MAWSHGFADGQKTMGVMALAVFAATQAGQLEHLPPWLQFLRAPKFEVVTWIKWSCGLAMAMGTYIGGWKIIRTLGHRLVSLKPINGFAAETTGATILLRNWNLRHARFDDAFDYDGHHGRRLRQKFSGARLGHHGAHLVGLGYDHSHRWRNWLSTGAAIGRLGHALECNTVCDPRQGRTAKRSGLRVFQPPPAAHGPRSSGSGENCEVMAS